MSTFDIHEINSSYNLIYMYLYMMHFLYRWTFHCLQVKTPHTQNISHRWADDEKKNLSTNLLITGINCRYRIMSGTLRTEQFSCYWTYMFIFSTMYMSHNTVGIAYKCSVIKCPATNSTHSEKDKKYFLLFKFVN